MRLLRLLLYLCLLSHWLACGWFQLGWREHDKCANRHSVSATANCGVEAICRSLQFAANFSSAAYGDVSTQLEAADAAASLAALNATAGLYGCAPAAFSCSSWTWRDALSCAGPDVQYLRSLYYCWVTIVAVGYGEIAAKGMAETLYAIILMMIGMMAALAPIHFPMRPVTTPTTWD